MQRWARGYRHVRAPKGVWIYSTELKHRLSSLRAPHVLAELLGNCLAVAFISNIVNTISDLFHVSLARKREIFLKLERNKLHQGEFLKFQISQPMRNDFFLIWSLALQRPPRALYQQEMNQSTAPNIPEIVLWQPPPSPSSKTEASAGEEGKNVLQLGA